MTEQQQYIQDDEITLKELILKIGEFWRELWKYWWLIGAITIPFVLYMGYKAYTAEVTYPAKLTFMVNKDEGGGLSAISGILGTFGLGGGGNKGGYNLDKMLQLLKSRRITEEAMMTEVEIDGRTDLLGNHVITNLDTLGKWAREPSFRNKEPDKLEGFLFKNNEQDPELHNSAIKRLQGKLIGSSENPGILSSGYNEDSGILHISFPAEHEGLAIALTKVYFERLSQFYSDKTIESQKRTFDLVKAKTDSIYFALQSKDNQLAKLVETTRSVFSPQEKIKEQQLQREIQKLSVMYAESAKNQEVADFSLKSSTPAIQLIDEPVSPLKPEGESLLKALIIGGFLGVFVGALIVIGRKIYKDTMASA